MHRFAGIVIKGSIYLVLLALCIGYVHAESEIVDYVILLDTSGSMVGMPPGSGNAHIFPNVKGAVKDFLHDVDTGSNVFIYQFDRGIQKKELFVIQSGRDIEQLSKYVDAIEATGENTWIYSSLKDVIDDMQDFTQRSDETHRVIILVYTDGLDNQGKYTMSDIMDYYQLKRRGFDFLYYTTLGVKMRPEDRKAIESAKHAFYIEQPRGVVHPIFLIEVKIPVLQFGNLMQKQAGTREEIFLIHNKDKLPHDVKLSVNTDFPVLGTMGVYGECTPKEFKPVDKQQFILTLVNAQDIETNRYGGFEGSMLFSSNDPMVLVVPDSIKIKFTYEPARVARISPAPGMMFPVNFGEVNVFKEGAAVIPAEKKILLQYNEQAQRRGGKLKVWPVFSSDNPAALKMGKDIHFDENEDEYIILTPKKEQLSISLHLSKTHKPGTYKGEVVFSSDDFAIQGESIEARGRNVYAIPWSFVIPEPPMAWWLKIVLIFIGLLVSCIAGLMLYCMITGASFPPWKTVPISFSMEIIEPEDQKNTRFDLADAFITKKTIKMGQGHHYMHDANVEFSVRYIKKGSRRLVKISAISGNVYLKKSGENTEEEIFEDELFDGDVVRCGKYRLRISSFSLMR